MATQRTHTHTRAIKTPGQKGTARRVCCRSRIRFLSIHTSKVYREIRRRARTAQAHTGRPEVMRGPCTNTTNVIRKLERDFDIIHITYCV